MRGIYAHEQTSKGIEAINELDVAFLGNLYLKGKPYTDPSEAVDKDYVDSAFANVGDLDLKGKVIPERLYPGFNADLINAVNNNNFVLKTLVTAGRYNRPVFDNTGRVMGGVPGSPSIGMFDIESIDYDTIKYPDNITSDMIMTEFNKSLYLNKISTNNITRPLRLNSYKQGNNTIIPEVEVKTIQGNYFNGSIAGKIETGLAPGGKNEPEEILEFNAILGKPWIYQSGLMELKPNKTFSNMPSTSFTLKEGAKFLYYYKGKVVFRSEADIIVYDVTGTKPVYLKTLTNRLPTTIVGDDCYLIENDILILGKDSLYHTLKLDSEGIVTSARISSITLPNHIGKFILNGRMYLLGHTKNKSNVSAAYPDPVTNKEFANASYYINVYTNGSFSAPVRLSNNFNINLVRVEKEYYSLRYGYFNTKFFRLGKWLYMLPYIGVLVRGSVFSSYFGTHYVYSYDGRYRYNFLYRIPLVDDIPTGSWSEYNLNFTVTAGGADSFLHLSNKIAGFTIYFKDPDNASSYLPEKPTGQGVWGYKSGYRTGDRYHWSFSHNTAGVISQTPASGLMMPVASAFSNKDPYILFSTGSYIGRYSDLTGRLVFYETGEKLLDLVGTADRDFLP